MSINDVYQWLEQMKNDSIYQGKRLAQPDEVANYQTGDGLEKALLLANLIHHRDSKQGIEINADNNTVTLKHQEIFSFNSSKGLRKKISIKEKKLIC